MNFFPLSSPFIEEGYITHSLTYRSEITIENVNNKISSEHSIVFKFIFFSCWFINLEFLRTDTLLDLNVSECSTFHAEIIRQDEVVHKFLLNRNRTFSVFFWRTMTSQITQYATEWHGNIRWNMNGKTFLFPRNSTQRSIQMNNTEMLDFQSKQRLQSWGCGHTYNSSLSSYVIENNKSLTLTQFMKLQ